VALAAGTTQFIELGVGRVLSGLVRRVQRDAAVLQIATPGDLAALAGVVS
jgi:malonyl CoA-acyl carrier protein transacylase